ncbi:MAG TPA: hypothetical protein VGB50_08675 [Flavobacterium sp.]|jgi:uncharacterized membrane-anchored protein YhcB (DUF1043 family)
MSKRIYILFLLISAFAFGQKPVTATLDTVKNKIGAEFKLTIKASADTTALVIFPQQKMFGPLEVIQSYPIDTVKDGARFQLIKKYGLTQFDSGKYTIPRLTVMIDKKPFLTDTFRVEVANVKVDTLKQKLYDIKDIVHTDRSFRKWWIYLLIPLVIAAIGFLVYRFIKKRQQQKGKLDLFKTPIEKANTLLQQLEKKELWQKGEVKEYYSELTDIARNYIEEAIHIPAMESTTSELIFALRNEAVKKNMTLSQETVENLEKVLRHADLVKFAKSRPLEYEIADDRKKIEKTIVTLDESIPEETTDDAALNEIMKKRLLRQQKIKRIAISAGVVVFLLMATTVYFTITKGFDYVKDNIIGHPTKELLEGEWIASEYGNPGVFVETPKVLKRMNAEQMLPKETIALLKEFQIFAYGSAMDNFFIMVSTNTFKAEQTPDLNIALEGGINVLEQQGFRNILFKQEEFETKAGISGVKGYGTAIKVNPLTKKDIKVYYEVLLFGQQNGLQQIMIMHEEGDKYAKEVSGRILNSVELKYTQG